MPQKIFFFHNPKAGGTSIMSALRNSYGNASQCPIIENNTDDHGKLAGCYSGFSGYDLYLGHYGRDVFSAVNDGHLYFTNFRHPVSRIISLYNYFRSLEMEAEQLQRECHSMVRLCKDLSFEQFVRSDNKHVGIYIENAHVRQLAKSFYEDLFLYSIDEVISFVDSMPCFYVCEFDQLSTSWLCEKLSIGIVGRENVNRTENSVVYSSLSNSTLQTIIDRNEDDLEIYRYAVNKLLTSRN